MPDENIRTTLQFQADISDFTGAMQEANRLIKLSNSEFKAAASGMDDWANTTDGLKAKLQQLANVQAAEERKLEALKKAYADVVREQGENSKAAQDLKTKINNQQAAVNKTAKEFDKFSERLEDVEKAADDVGDALEDAGDAAKDAGKEAEKASDGWSITRDIIADLAADAISSFIDAIANAAEETRDYRREMAKMSENAKDAGHDMEDVKDTLSEVAASTGDTEAAMEGLNMLMASGFDTRELDKASKALAGAATRFDGLNFESMAEGLQETLSVGKAVGPFAELIERTGGNLEKFDEGLEKCTTAAEKQQYALDFLAKSGLADVHAAYVQNHSDLVEAEKAQFRHNEAMAKMGAAIEPLDTHFTNLSATLMEKVAPAIEKVVDFFLDNLPVIEPLLAGVAAAMAVLAAKMAITGIIKGVQTAFAALNATMKANPILLVVSALAALAGALTAVAANKTQQFIDAAKAWAAAVTPFNSAINSAKANTVNFDKALSETGRTMSDLRDAITQAENGITEILSTAMGEQRALREDELIQIQTYNQRIRELEAEKLTIYRQQMEAELAMLQHRGQVTQEEAAQTLANQREYLAQANEAARLAYQNELIQLQNKHKAAGTLNSEAYKNEVDNAQSHYDKQLEENEKFYGKSVSLLMESAKEWVGVDAKRWNQAEERAKNSREELAYWLSQIDSDNANAFLSMYHTTVKTGGKISKETRDIASDMVMSFNGMPKDMEDQAHAALMGMIVGMEEEIPQLKHASEMTAQEIVDVLSRELEINSPSRVTKRIGGYVTEGLGRGMTEKENWLQREVGGFLGRTLDFFKNALGIHSPSKETEWMGEMFAAGLVKGIENGRRDVQSAIEGLTASSLDGARVGINGPGGTGAAGGKSIVFTQNNYSPKALSRREIYRQTHNILAYAGGE
ncbi:MAG: hypothetical protein IJP04_07835 [Clostridia bacterium]|nr:hypothetical protein [Clostridia bacterium]